MLRAILSNSFFALVSDIAQRLPLAILLVLIARELGEAGAGVFALGNNYLLILSAIALWGLDQLLICEVARDRCLSTIYLVHSLAIRLVMASVLWLLLLGLLLEFRPYSLHTTRFIVMVVGVLVGDSVSNLMQSYFVAIERMWIPALVSVCTGISRLIIGAIAVSYSLEVLALILILTSWIQAIVLTWLTRGYLSLVGFHFDMDFCRRQLSAGFPFVPIALFIALENQLGGILLSFSHSEAVVGYYGMANVIISALALLSQALRIGIFPTMARLYRTECNHFVRLYERSWRYLSIVSLPMVLLVILLSDRIIHSIYGQAGSQATLTLQWLAPTLLFYFLNIPNARVMILDGRQRTLAKFFGISTGANVLVCLLFIQLYGLQAVAAARVVSMSILFAMNCAYVYRRILRVQPWHLVWRPLFASSVMALVIFRMLPACSDIVRCLTGMGVYGIALTFLRAIPSTEWAWLRQRLPFRNRCPVPGRPCTSSPRKSG